MNGGSAGSVARAVATCDMPHRRRDGRGWPAGSVASSGNGCDGRRRARVKRVCTRSITYGTGNVAAANGGATADRRRRWCGWRRSGGGRGRRGGRGDGGGVAVVLKHGAGGGVDDGVKRQHKEGDRQSGALAKWQERGGGDDRCGRSSMWPVAWRRGAGGRVACGGVSVTAPGVGTWVGG